MSTSAIEMIRSDVKAVKAALAEVEASMEYINAEQYRLFFRRDALLTEQRRLIELANKIENDQVSHE